MTSIYAAVNDVNDFFDKVMQLLEDYEKLGPVPGILLPYIEAFLPFLPLFVFVMANSVAYGLLKGFVYSWIGSVGGATTVFFIIRTFKEKPWIKKITNHKQVERITSWVEEKGFSLLFILLCFPFSPSSVINIVAAISKVSWKQFLLAVILGKGIMIFSIAYIGTSILEFAKNPLKTIIVSIIIVLFWLIGKLIENRMLKKE